MLRDWPNALPATGHICDEVRNPAPYRGKMPFCTRRTKSWIVAARRRFRFCENAVLEGGVHDRARLSLRETGAWFWIKTLDVEQGHSQRKNEHEKKHPWKTIRFGPGV
jgi:hypothetical protein